jgi:hypothetical protein
MGFLSAAIAVYQTRLSSANQPGKIAETEFSETDVFLSRSKIPNHHHPPLQGTGHEIDGGRATTLASTHVKLVS